MEKQDLINQINELLSEEFEVELSDIKPTGNIKTALSLDSLSLVDLVALIENTFNVRIKGSEMSSILTFDNLYDYIYERIGK